MDRFGFLSEYLKDSLSSMKEYCMENEVLVNSDSDDCGLFFSQQPKDSNVDVKSVQDDIDFDGLFEQESILNSVPYEPMVFNQRMEEISASENKKLEVYTPIVEEISEDERCASDIARFIKLIFCHDVTFLSYYIYLVCLFIMV